MKCLISFVPYLEKKNIALTIHGLYKLKNEIRQINKLCNTYITKKCLISFIKYKKLNNKINTNIKYEKNKY